MVQGGAHPPHEPSPLVAPDYIPSRPREIRTNRVTAAEPTDPEEALKQMRQKLAAAEAEQAATAAEVNRLRALNEELAIAKNAMLADMQVCAPVLIPWNL